VFVYVYLFFYFVHVYVCLFKPDKALIKSVKVECGTASPSKKNPEREDLKKRKKRIKN